MSKEELSFNIEDSIVFLPKTEIDSETMNQIMLMSKEPTTNHARFMPDCHKSSGYVLAFTDMIKKELFLIMWVVTLDVVF